MACREAFIVIMQPQGHSQHPRQRRPKAGGQSRLPQPCSSPGIASHQRIEMFPCLEERIVRPVIAADQRARLVVRLFEAVENELLEPFQAFGINSDRSDGGSVQWNIARQPRMNNGAIQREAFKEWTGLQIGPSSRFRIKASAAPAEDKIPQIGIVEIEPGRSQEGETVQEVIIDGDGNVRMDRIAEHEDLPRVRGACSRFVMPERPRYDDADTDEEHYSKNDVENALEYP